ncbi:MAG: helix-turn-helix domain-containing protein [Thermoprotei archaeon]|nr:helix-turn-helix domain-containing protein [Thermoprotei archaeon]
MKPYCEVMTKLIVPAIRALVAIKLINEYGMTQVEVAKRLGLTQPAISYYLRSKRGQPAVIEKLKSDQKVTGLIARLTDLVYRNATQEELQEVLCEICTYIRKGNILNDALI